MNFKNFSNIINGTDTIFSKEDIAKMNSDKFSSEEKAIFYQLNKIGIPSTYELKNNSDVVFIEEYTKNDGTIVKSHFRAKPDNTTSNNLNQLASNLNPIQKQLVNFNNLKNNNRPQAKELMDFSINGIKNINNNTDDYKILSKNESETINKLFNLKNTNLEIKKEWNGLRYSSDSEFCKNLSTSPQLQKQIRDYCKKHKNLSNNDKIIGLELNEDKNLHYSIGHCSILNPNINKNGYFSGLVFDKYDFSPLYKNLNSETTKLNNGAYALQSLKQLENYYVIIPIKFKL